ncbi:MAG: hypothetical protein KAT32_03780 [Candidatus Moranbacteria bacterium]|nr:hypothetical protein [Candidatus Moranbacteria bacterium]
MKALNKFSKKDILFAFIITILIVFWQFFTVIINDDFKTYYTKEQKENGYRSGSKVFEYGFPLTFIDANEEVLEEMGISKFINHLKLFLNPLLIFALSLFLVRKIKLYKFIEKNINKQKNAKRFLNILLSFLGFYFFSFMINNFSYFTYERGHKIPSQSTLINDPFILAIIIFIYFILLILVISLIKKYRKIKENKLPFENFSKSFYLYVALFIFMPFVLILVFIYTTYIISYFI